MSAIQELNGAVIETGKPLLNWTEGDIEQRLGFRGGRFTSANRLLTFFIAVILTVLFYVLMIFVFKPRPALAWIADKFLERGICPYPTMFFFFWSVAILYLKGRKLVFQRRSLALNAVPQQPDFILHTGTAGDVLARVHRLVDDTRHFVLLNRVDRALSNLRNIGQISDVSQILSAQADFDEAQIASSYNLVTGFVWAIPVLGFIGTVLGLGDAIGSFGLTLQAGGDLSKIKDSLQLVTGGLATAFDTTLIALVGALIIQLYLTHLQHREAEFLDECNDYCHAHLVTKLRVSKD
jgi:biopolymer transport protein ExbB/TolQ